MVQTHSINITFDTWPKAALRWRGVSAMAGLNRLFWSDLITQAAIGMATEYQCRQINEPDAAIRDLERLRDQAGRQDGGNCP